MSNSWDIFCRVVDNFGDIGVTWRLARQLTADYNADVRLWVDDLTAFRRLCPELNSGLAEQSQQGVIIRHWPGSNEQATWQSAEPLVVADVVIEAFACELPQPYIEAMQTRTKAPLWLNLEYLSAESWVDECHALPSLQNNGLKKYFFFPGFTDGTGGLLRESKLIEHRQAFQESPQQQQFFMQRIGIAQLSDARRVSLFSYENPSIGSWLETLAKVDNQPTHLLVPDGKILNDIKHWLNLTDFKVGDSAIRGHLTIQVLPFLSQDDYDRLLWLCDVNIVRGEDSFVRAQWAGRPMVWHIYPQEENAHLVKLDAFMALYCQLLQPEDERLIRALWLGWNRGVDVSEPWLSMQANESHFVLHAKSWCQLQKSHQNLTKSLVQFYLNWI